MRRVTKFEKDFACPGLAIRCRFYFIEENMTNKKKSLMTQYFVWDESSDDPEDHNWDIYDSMECAVNDKGEGVEIFEAKLKSIGKWKKKTTIVKMR